MLVFFQASVLRLVPFVWATRLMTYSIQPTPMIRQVDPKPHGHYEPSALNPESLSPKPLHLR